MLRVGTRLPLSSAGWFSVLALLLVGLAGCYTILQHPNVAREELSAAQAQDSAGGYRETTCTDCHNNQYDHTWGNQSWGWGNWNGYTGGFYPYGSYGYSPWRRYYWDPWWGWNSGWGGWSDPWPYYPNNPPGGGTPGTEPPKRSPIGRGELAPPTPPPQAPPPSYNPPPNQNQGQEQNNQQNNNQEPKKRGKSGRG